MIEEENKEQKELEVKLDDSPEEKEIDVPQNPIDAMVQSAVEEEKEEVEAKPETETKKVPQY